VIDGDTACRLRVAFVDGALPVVGSQPGHREVWIANPDGSGLLNLSNDDNADDINPSWSPNGLRIAFASNRTGKFDIFVVNVDGTGLANLTAGSDLPFDATNPVWSPDGTRIAFVHGLSVWTMNANGTGASQLSTKSTSGSLAWSPTNTQLVFPAGPGVTALYVATIGSSSPPVKLTAGTGLEVGQVWAPAVKIAFSNDSDIFTINGDGTSLFNVTQSAAGGNSSPVVTNDGNTIVFESTRDNGHTELWSIPAIGGTATQITHHTIMFGGDFPTDISPDGSLISYSRSTTTVNGTNSTTVSELGIIGIDGSSAHMFNAPGQHNASSGTFSSCQ
jgi:Tol biopolymer transport system component